MFGNDRSEVIRNISPTPTLTQKQLTPELMNVHVNPMDNNVFSQTKFPAPSDRPRSEYH